jgi:hypothetical protein
MAGLSSKWVVASILVLAGCAGAVPDARESDSPAAGPTGAPSASAALPAITRDSLQRQLVLDLQPRAATGSFTLDANNRLTFHSVERDDRTVETTVEMHGMTLDATIDPVNGVSSTDIFATANGHDTQITEADRPLIAGFYQALNMRLPTETYPAAKLMRRMVGVWTEHPATLPSAQLIMGEENRTIRMLCAWVSCSNSGAWSGNCDYYRWYSVADHDCCRNWWGTDCHDYNDPDQRNQQYAQLGDHYGDCGGDEWYWNGNSWSCGEPDHWQRPYAMGGCWGRSGASCGSDTQYTLDATNHDGCVRNGHDLASLYCDDEFTSAADDELYAPDCYRLNSAGGNEGTLQDIPSQWTCSASWFAANDGCDCGCGAPDPDCFLGGRTGGCYTHAGDGSEICNRSDCQYQW